MIEAIIFDMDGVIVDGETSNYIAVNKVLQPCGFVLTPEEYKQTIGLNSFETWSLLKRKFSLKENTEDLMEMFSRLQDSGYTEAPLMPGFMKFFTLVKNRNLKIAVASSTEMRHIKGVLDRIGIIGKFNVIASAEECKNGKPKPDVYLLAAKRLEIDPGRCIAIEDSMNGMLAAKAAGMFVIAVPTEHTRSQDFSKADLIVRNLNEIDEDRLKSLLSTK
jgi:HAD superfamily hydrolase (TIGR01509 family)